MPRRVSILLLALGAFLTISSFYLSGPTVSELTFRGKNDRSVPVLLPFLHESAPGRVFRFSGTITWHFPETTFVRIIPDDCATRLALNGLEVPLEHLSEGSVCDWGSGFLIDLREHLREGANSFELSVDNRKGRAALRMLAENRKLLESVPALFLAAAATALLYLSARRLKLSPELSFLLVCGLALRLFYLSETGPYDRTYDVYVPTGHYDYIRYIRMKLALPPANGGWQYHQAPLYYLLAAGFQIVTRSADSLAGLFELQLLSLLFSVGFLLYALRTYAEVLPERSAVLLASALTIFWPSAVIHSVRIGNDGLLYLFSAAAVYHSIVWFRREERQDLLWASIAASFAVLTKSNGAVLVVYFWALFAVKLFRHKGERRTFLWSGLTALALTALAVGAELGPKLTAFVGGDSAHWIVGNSPLSINPKLYVNNGVENYLRFDLRTFLGVPYSGAWSDEGGRQLFWNYFLKSALFGEFAFRSNEKILFANGAAALFLAMLAFGALGARHLARHLGEPAPIVFIFALYLFAALVFRAAIPIASAADFRYSFAMLIPGCILYAQGAGLTRLAFGWSFALYSIAHTILG